VSAEVPGVQQPWTETEPASLPQVSKPLSRCELRFSSHRHCHRFGIATSRIRDNHCNLVDAHTTGSSAVPNHFALPHDVTQTDFPVVAQFTSCRILGIAGNCTALAGPDDIGLCCHRRNDRGFCTAIGVFSWLRLHASDHQRPTKCQVGRSHHARPFLMCHMTKKRCREHLMLPGISSTETELTPQSGQVANRAFAFLLVYLTDSDIFLFREIGGASSGLTV